MKTNTSEVDVLTRAGFIVRARSASELSLARGAEQLVVHLIRQKTSPTRSQLEQTRRLPAGEIVLFVMPRATLRVRELVAHEPRAWLVTHDGAAILGRSDPSTANPGRPTTRGRIPWGRYALMRALMRLPEPRTQQQLAFEVGLTQGAVSGALAKLGVAARTDAGWTATDPQLLWDVFLTEYPGAQGVRTHWYSRLPFVRQSELLRPHARLSADAGADAIAPWRAPMRTVAYVAKPVDMEALGFSPATAEEANVDVVMPADRTVFATAAAWGLGVADPLLIAWDLRDVGGNDAEDAIAQLRRLALERFLA